MKCRIQESGEESVTLQSHNGQGLGFEVSARPDGSFTVDHVKSDGIAGATGKIKAGKRLLIIIVRSQQTSDRIASQISRLQSIRHSVLIVN